MAILDWIGIAGAVVAFFFGLAFLFSNKGKSFFICLFSFLFFFVFCLVDGSHSLARLINVDWEVVGQIALSPQSQVLDDGASYIFQSGPMAVRILKKDVQIISCKSTSNQNLLLNYDIKQRNWVSSKESPWQAYLPPGTLVEGKKLE